ncbi:orotidine-5'-phosphate decarboxylase, partial [Patescibacteria group bacterium]|nr:orotidine-5'-phosphate decarboxylase [Patescibacteria group bacterium]
MNNFADRLIDAIKKKSSAICVGLDPRLEQIPEFIKKKHTDKMGFTFEAAAHAVLEFNKGIIDATADLVPCVKPQIAFYEQYGFEGIWAYEATVDYAKEKGLLVIADAKRNDIGSTAKGYANAFLGQVDLFGGKYFSLDCDALTVTPYLGADGVNPFIDACRDFGKGIFVLVKTSNFSSGDLQDQILEKGSMPVYELMANFVESWGADLIGENGYSSIGAVVGATYPKQAAELRKIMPQTIFLVPGYGA